MHRFLAAWAVVAACVCTIPCRVHALDVNKYLSLLRQDTYLADLPALVSRCLAGLRETNRAACNDAEYISKVGSAMADLVAGAGSAASASPIASLPSASSSGGTFERVFLDYINANKPLKGMMEKPFPAADIVKTCAPPADAATAATDYPLHRCMDYTSLQGLVVVPGAAANNYLFRLNATGTALEPADVDYRAHWPAVAAVDVARTPVVRACPQVTF